MFLFFQYPWTSFHNAFMFVASRGNVGGKLTVAEDPGEMLEQYSADAVRYWAASVRTGGDTLLSEDVFKNGQRLVTKLWNVAKFSQRFLAGYRLPALSGVLPAFTPTDRWLLSRAQRVIQRVTDHFHRYDYAAAKSEVESFFWRDLADNYLEMAKERLYDEANAKRDGARYTLYSVLLTVLKLFAPFFPYITEEIYQSLFTASEGEGSIHTSRWPIANDALISDEAEADGELLIEIATAVRRYKAGARGATRVPRSNPVRRTCSRPV